MKPKQRNGKEYVPPEYQAFLDEEERKRIAALPSFTDFESYVKANPEGEIFRNWMTRNQKYSRIVIVPASLHQNGIPGGYVWGSIYVWPKDYKKPKKDELVWQVTVHDNDDGCMIQVFDTEDLAIKALDQLVDLAPLALFDLKHFGYEYN
jgi:hypothetical protein